MKVTFSAWREIPRASSRRLSTTFPYRSSIRTVISTSPPAVTSGLYQRPAIACGIVWSICRSMLFLNGSSGPSYGAVAVIFAVPATVPGLKSAIAFPSESVTACRGDMLPYVPSTSKSTPTPSSGEVLFLTCTVMVAALSPPAVNHTGLALIVMLSGINAPAGAARRSSPTARYAYVCSFILHRICSYHNKVYKYY
ncbi:hypothetical protein DSECCO2_657660 [anaerobic digester metagenome]